MSKLKKIWIVTLFRGNQKIEHEVKFPIPISEEEAKRLALVNFIGQGFTAEKAK